MLLVVDRRGDVGLTVRTAAALTRIADVDAVELKVRQEVPSQIPQRFIDIRDSSLSNLIALMLVLGL